LWPAFWVVLASILAAALSHGAPAVAQPPLPPTPTAGPTLPPPDIGGRWSITRAWHRRCPACARTVVLTTPWLIQQSGAEVRVDRGPRGAIVSDGAGGGYLALEGIEQSGPSTLRLWYATLRVSPGGSVFEGAFDGSEQTLNPCGSNPPIVTCFASAGWIRAQRVEPATPTPTPPVPPAATATAVSPTTAATATAVSPTTAATATAPPTAPVPAPATTVPPPPAPTPTVPATPPVSPIPPPSATAPTVTPALPTGTPTAPLPSATPPLVRRFLPWADRP